MKPKIDVSPSARVIWLPAMLVVYLGALASGAAGGIISTAENDARMIQKLAETIVASKVEGSYAVMAFLYAHTSEIQRLGVELAAGVLFILYCMGSLRTHRTLGVVAFWLIGPMIFFLTIFNKDTIVVFFILGAALALRSPLPLIVRTSLVLAIYVVYAAIFRQYYFLIAGVFVALLILRRVPPLACLAICLFGFAILALLPPEFFSQLQSPRDMGNLGRIGRNIPGMRTAFGNIVPPTDYFNFLLNYGYAAIRLNVPFFSGITVRDLYLFINVFLFSWVVTIGFRSNLKTSDSTALFLSHVIVSICFEPDVGSYLRHVSSAMPYLVPALIVVDRTWSAQSRLQPSPGGAAATARRSAQPPAGARRSARPL